MAKNKRSKNIHILAEIDNIDYQVFCRRLAKPKDKGGMWSKIASFFIKPGLLSLVPLGFIGNQIRKICSEYGISLSTMHIDKEAPTYRKRGGLCMFNISTSLEIDYEKLARTVAESMGKNSIGGSNSTIVELVRIVAPFINNTMATVPPTALLQIFDLLARDKVVKAAESWGVKLVNLDVSH